MILPPGGFLVLGLLLAAKRARELRRSAAPGSAAAVSPAPTFS